MSNSPGPRQDADLSPNAGGNATGAVAREVQSRYAGKFQDSNGYCQVDNNLQGLDGYQPTAEQDRE